MNRHLLLSGGLALALCNAASLAFPQPSPSQETGPFKVTFVLDMREEIAARRFAPYKDAVGVRGGVEPLTWHTTLPASDADGDGRYEVTVTFPRRPFGGQPVNYKYKVEAAANPQGGWEEGRNRRLFLASPVPAVGRRFNEPPPPIQPALTGDIRRHPAFASRHPARRLRDALIAKGWVLGADLAYLEQAGGGHDEIAWASRVEPMLRFLYGDAAKR